MKFLTFLILLLLSHNLYATVYHVYGKLKDKKTNQPIGFATVAVRYLKNDNIVVSMVADSKGEFSFEVKPGKYRLDIRCLGYKPTTKPIEVFDRDLFLKAIEMFVEYNTLNEINVVGSGYYEQYDRSIQNITKQFKEGTSNVKDLLSKMRGIYVDLLDNSVKVDNEGNVLLLVDGIKKEQSYVKNLSPNRVSRIEVTRNPTGRYITAGYTSVINIILKKNYTGYDLLLEEKGLYSLDKSNGDDFLFKNEVKTNFTYTFKKINLYGLYSNTKKNTNLIVDNCKMLGDISLKNVSSSIPNVEKDELSYNYLLGLDLFINANQTISLETNIIRSPFDKNNLFKTYNNVFNSGYENEVFVSQLNNARFDKKLYSLLSYRNKFSEKNKLELDYAYNDVELRKTNIYSEDGVELSNQKVQSKRKTSILDLNFNHLFNDTYSLEFGYRNTYRTYNYSYLSQNIEKKKNKDVRNMVYTYFSYTPKSKVKVKIGIATEQNSLTTNNQYESYCSLHPFLNIFYKYSEKFNATLILNSNSYYPSAGQISPFETTIDRLTTIIGNPDLNFATKYTSSLNFKLFKNKLSIEPYYSITKNYISQTGSIVDEHFQYTYSNLDQYKSAGVKIGTKLDLIPQKMFLNFSGSLYSDKTKFNGYSNHINDFRFNGNLIYFSLKHKTLYALMLKKMNAKQISAYGYGSSDNDYLGCFVKQAFFDQKLSVSVLYILPVYSGFSYSMKGYFKHDTYKNETKPNVEVLTNLFMLNLSFNFNKGADIQEVKKKNYKERQEFNKFF